VTTSGSHDRSRARAAAGVTFLLRTLLALGVGLATAAML